MKDWEPEEMNRELNRLNRIITLCRETLCKAGHCGEGHLPDMIERALKEARDRAAEDERRLHENEAREFQHVANKCWDLVMQAGGPDEGELSDAVQWAMDERGRLLSRIDDLLIRLDYFFHNYNVTSSSFQQRFVEPLKELINTIHKENSPTK